MDQAPAYQMYAGDWLKGRRVRMMTDFQRGWYIQLLNEAWDGEPQCKLPNDTAVLQQLAGVSDLARKQPDFNERWTFVQRMFTVAGEYVYNERQMEELTKQIHRRELAVKAGRASAKRRDERRKELQRIKKSLVADTNGRSTDAEQTFNGNPTLHTPSPTPSPSPSSPTLAPPSGDAETALDLTPEPPKEPKRKKTRKPKEPKEPKPREPNPIWDKLVALFFRDGVPTGQNSRVGKLARDLAELGATPDEIERRYRKASTTWPSGSAFAPETLIKHWSQLGAGAQAQRATRF